MNKNSKSYRRNKAKISFRHMLQKLFIWRLKINQPDVIELGIDTMVMDNDDAGRRHGVKPTYKKKKGFQPLQMNWGRLIVDAVFRGGNKHSNYGTTVDQMIRHKDIVSVAASVDEKAWRRYDPGKKESWEYIEFAS
jgi:hypothetical protein